jgi:adenylate cyclase class 2
MNIEIELKARLDNPKQVEAKLKKIARFVRQKRQKDVYYVPKSKDFFAIKKTKEYLRVRYDEGKDQLAYHVCSYLSEEKQSTKEFEVYVDNPRLTETILKGIGFRRRVVVYKTRRYYSMSGFEVVLDNVKGLGSFIEVEAKKDFGGIDKTMERCREVLKRLGLEKVKKINKGYPDLILGK